MDIEIISLDVTFDIEKEDIKKYQMEHPVCYCANYNPLRMLMKKN